MIQNREYGCSASAWIIIGMLMIAPIIALADVFQVTTTNGTGGISGYIQNPTNASVFGSNFHVKNYGSSTVTRKGYIRFDTSGLHFTPAHATLSLTVATIVTNIADYDQTIYVYGLTNQALDLVALTDGLAWSNAPANNPTSWHETDLTKAELLGTFIVDYNGDYASPTGTVVQFSSAALASFVAADTNGLVTFLIGRTGTQSQDNLLFAGDNSTTHSSPKLTCGTGFLSMTSLGNGNVNISALSKADWMIWTNANLVADERMQEGRGLGALSFSSSSSLQAGNSAFSLLYSWTNGTPTASAANLDVNLLLSQGDATNAVFSTSVTATPASNSVYVTFGQWNAASEITASLSDGSASPQALSFATAQHQTVRIDFSSNPRATLNVSVRLTAITGSGGNIRFQSVALANVIPDVGSVFRFH